MTDTCLKIPELKCQGGERVMSRSMDTRSFYLFIFVTSLYAPIEPIILLYSVYRLFANSVNCSLVICYSSYPSSSSCRLD